jgi:hypothetical protein
MAAACIGANPSLCAASPLRRVPAASPSTGFWAFQGLSTAALMTRRPLLKPNEAAEVDRDASALTEHSAIKAVTRERQVELIKHLQNFPLSLARGQLNYSDVANHDILAQVPPGYKTLIHNIQRHHRRDPVELLIAIAGAILVEMAQHPDEDRFDESMMVELQKAIDWINAVPRSQSHLVNPLSIPDLFVVTLLGQVVDNRDLLWLSSLNAQLQRLPGDYKYRVTAYHLLIQSLHNKRRIQSNVEAIDIELLANSLPFILSSIEDRTLDPLRRKELERSLVVMLQLIKPYLTIWYEIYAGSAVEPEIDRVHAILRAYGGKKLNDMLERMRDQDLYNRVPLYKIFFNTGNLPPLSSAEPPVDILFNPEIPAHQALLSDYVTSTDLIGIYHRTTEDPRQLYAEVSYFLLHDLNLPPGQIAAYGSPLISKRGALDAFTSSPWTPHALSTFLLHLFIGREEGLLKILTTLKEVSEKRNPEWRQELTSAAEFFSDDSYAANLFKRLDELLDESDPAKAAERVRVPVLTAIEKLPFVLRFGFFDNLGKREHKGVTLIYNTRRANLNRFRTADNPALGWGSVIGDMPLEAKGNLPKKNLWAIALRIAESDGTLVWLHPSELDVTATLAANHYLSKEEFDDLRQALGAVFTDHGTRASA